MGAVLWGLGAVAKINLQRGFADGRIKNPVPRCHVKGFDEFKQGD
jgi:hypothetical protein